MPNARILSEKKKIVEDLTEKLKCQAGVFVNYSGITVNEDTEMRVKMREANVDYTVIKNTLMRFAIKNVGFEELEPILSGTTSLAVSNDDPVAPARIIKEYTDKFTDYFAIKGGFMDGKILSVAEVNALASIPPLPVLQAQLLGTMLAPIASLAVVLKAIAEKGIAPVDAQLSDTAGDIEPTEKSAESAAETPAEEPAPAETVAETPAEEPAPAEAVAETLAEEPAPAEAVAETPAEEPAPAKAVAEKLTEDPAPIESATETPAEKPAAKKPSAKAKAAAPAEKSASDDIENETAEAAPVKKPAPKKTAAKAKEQEPLPLEPASDTTDE